MVGRPRLPVSTFGLIKTAKVDSGRVRAWSRYRDRFSVHPHDTARHGILLAQAQAGPLLLNEPSYAEMVRILTRGLAPMSDRDSPGHSCAEDRWVVVAAPAVGRLALEDFGKRFLGREVPFH